MKVFLRSCECSWIHTINDKMSSGTRRASLQAKINPVTATRAIEARHTLGPVWGRIWEPKPDSFCTVKQHAHCYLHINGRGIWAHHGMTLPLRYSLSALPEPESSSIDSLLSEICEPLAKRSIFHKDMLLISIARQHIGEGPACLFQGSHVSPPVSCRSDGDRQWLDNNDRVRDWTLQE